MLAKAEPNAICRQCGKAFHRKQSQLDKYKHHYCSKACMTLFQQKDQIALKCDECGKIFYRKASHVPRRKHSFCCMPCAHTYMYREWKKEAFEKANYRRPVSFCQVCGWNEVDILLSIHWLDGNSANKDDSNILVVCPICREKIKARLLPQYADRG